MSLLGFISMNEYKFGIKINVNLNSVPAVRQIGFISFGLMFIEQQ